MKCTEHLHRLALGGMILLGGIIAGPLSSVHGHAQIVTCRSDPIIKMSNGKQLKLLSTIFDSSTYVSKVAYVVHIPSGVAMSGLTYTGGAFAGKENVVVYADNAANTYSNALTVSESHSSINVTAQEVLATSSGSTIAQISVTGFANTTIKEQVSG